MEFWDWEKNKELMGIYVGQLKSIGRFKRNVYVFNINSEDIEKVYVWNSSQLNNLLYGVPFKTKLKLNFIGWATMVSSSRKFRDFTIEFLEQE